MKPYQMQTGMQITQVPSCCGAFTIFGFPFPSIYLDVKDFPATLKKTEADLSYLLDTWLGKEIELKAHQWSARERKNGLNKHFAQVILTDSQRDFCGHVVEAQGFKHVLSFPATGGGKLLHLYLWLGDSTYDPSIKVVWQDTPAKLMVDTNHQLVAMNKTLQERISVLEKRLIRRSSLRAGRLKKPARPR